MLLPSSSFNATPPEPEPTTEDVRGMELALKEARDGAQEGGIPIGAALVGSKGQVLSTGRNRRIQLGSATRHGEIDCLESAGRLSAAAFQGATLYTTLSPCTMCAGAAILFGIKRVVIGENTTFLGGEDILQSRSVTIVNLDLQECKELMGQFIRQSPQDWFEDIGEST